MRRSALTRTRAERDEYARDTNRRSCRGKDCDRTKVRDHIVKVVNDGKLSQRHLSELAHRARRRAPLMARKNGRRRP
jgi:hypothetical protein